MKIRILLEENYKNLKKIISEEITKEILDPTKISILKNRKILELLPSSKSTKKIINKPQKNNDMILKDKFFNETEKFINNKDYNSDSLNKLLNNYVDNFQTITNFNSLKNILFRISKLNISSNCIALEILIKKLGLQIKVIKEISISDKIVIIFSLSKMSDIMNENLRTESKKLINELLTGIIENEDFKNKIDIKNMTHLLYACNKFKIIDRKLIYFIGNYFQSNLIKFNDIDIVSSIYSLVKIYSFLNNDDQDLGNFIKEIFHFNDELISRIKLFLNSSFSDIRNIVNLCWSLSRLSFMDEEIWQLFINYLLTNYKKLTDDNFRIMVSSITSVRQGEISSIMILKNHFDEKLKLKFDTYSTVNFIRLFRSFSHNHKYSFINEDDESFPLYIDFINKNFDKFIDEELVTLITCMASINYFNENLIDRILNHFTCKEIKFNSLIKDNIGLLIWSICLMNIKRKDIWILFQKYLEKYNLNSSEITVNRNFLIGMIHLKIFFNNYIILEEQKFDKLLFELKKEFFKKINYPQYKNYSQPKIFSNFEIYYFLKALEIEFIPEMIIDIYNVDFFILNFKNIDFKEKETNLKKYFLNFMDLKKNNRNDYQNDMTEDSFIQLSENNKENGLVIEIYGLTHFIKKDHIKGATLYKEKMLKNLNYNVYTLTSEKCAEFSSKTSNYESRLLLFIRSLMNYQLNLFKN